MRVGSSTMCVLDHEAWQQVPLPAEPSCLPCTAYIETRPVRHRALDIIVLLPVWDEVLGLSTQVHFLFSSHSCSGYCYAKQPQGTMPLLVLVWVEMGRSYRVGSRVGLTGGYLFETTGVQPL